MDQSKIRNFCIIAHIDHGKSTLADRILENTGAIQRREMKDQFLDNLSIERERGITVKAQTVSLAYRSKAGGEYLLNLIDTPGHVDFAYEVSRSIAACEGALLVVDAVQGVEAQTLANVYLALENDLEILPVVNKVDLPAADPARVKGELENLIGLETTHAVEASAKKGLGVVDILEQVVERVPPPRGDAKAPLKALIFDSWFDSFLGVIVLFRVFEGTVRKNDKILFMQTGKSHQINQLGKFSPHKVEVEEIRAGEVGFLAASIKTLGDANTGDTVTLFDAPAAQSLAGYREVKPMVFSGIYPTDSGEYKELQDSLAKLALNDSSFTFEPETSVALGFGFRCGFLGLLHMEIVQERLEREYGLNLLITAPTVVYQVYDSEGKMLRVENPGQLPPAQSIDRIEEPFVTGTVYVPERFLGSVLQLCLEKRGVRKSLEYLSTERVRVRFELPLNEIVFEFHDRLKSISKGYASFDYEMEGYRPSSLVRLDVLLNGDLIDAFSVIVFKDKAYSRGRELTKQLKGIIPRQMYEIAIQAAVGSKVIARETVGALRKNVTAKCYGGDISRKRKLLEKQKEGKKRMRRFGNVEVPQEAFTAVFKIRKD